MFWNVVRGRKDWHSHVFLVELGQNCNCPVAMLTLCTWHGHDKKITVCVRVLLTGIYNSCAQRLDITHASTPKVVHMHQDVLHLCWQGRHSDVERVFDRESMRIHILTYNQFSCPSGLRPQRVSRTVSCSVVREVLYLWGRGAPPSLQVPPHPLQALLLPALPQVVLECLAPHPGPHRTLRPLLSQ